MALATASKDDCQGHEQLHLQVLDAMQLCYEENASTLSNSDNSHLAYESHGVDTNHENIGRLWKWKGNHQRWCLQFKWKWQKPWRLAQWIQQNDTARSLSNAFVCRRRHTRHPVAPKIVQGPQAAEHLG